MAHAIPPARGRFYVHRDEDGWTVVDAPYGSCVSFETRAEADDFDGEVVVCEGELVAQRDGGVVVAQERAKNVGELDGHLACELGLDADQRGDGVECVEEEVGIDLAAERVKARLKEEAALLIELEFKAERVPDLEHDADDHGRGDED